MSARYKKGNKLVCPRCNQENDLAAEYCWKCYFDFIPNEPSMQRAQQQSIDEIMEESTPLWLAFLTLLFRIAISTGIVYSTWLLTRHFQIDGLFTKAPPIAMFVFLWILYLLFVYIGERSLPTASTDWTDYISLNPFQFQDDYHRFVLTWKILLFPGRIVLNTLIKLFVWR